MKVANILLVGIIAVLKQLELNKSKTVSFYRFWLVINNNKQVLILHIMIPAFFILYMYDPRPFGDRDIGTLWSPVTHGVKPCV